jgi:glyoxylase-like metal-dependent hydrolase (beta-lactamase superfamily II)
MKFTQLDANLFVWTDLCNVYVLRQGDKAILIDLGDGSVLDALPQLGVKTVEWVLFTHHHREQCHGAPRLTDSASKFAAPQAERALFEEPHTFRKLRISLADPHTVHGASYVRPPLEPITLHRGFKHMDTFQWQGHEIWCVATPGNSPGGMSYLLQLDGEWIAFSGDIMVDGAKWHNWFDTEWDYGFAKGLYALYSSASLLSNFDAKLLCPSHGNTIADPAPQFQEYLRKLKDLVPKFLRGWDVYTLAGGDQDNYSRPTNIPHLWHVTPHIYKFKGPEFWSNFTLLVADDGHALAIDCGVDRTLLDETLRRMQLEMRLKQVDAVIITHMHGDHCVDAPYLREKWGAKIWAHERVAPKLEHPEWFDYSAPVQAYGPTLDRVTCDGVFRDGELIDWHGYQLTIDWMPGQTEFHCGIHGKIDDMLVVFTGDNIFANPADPQQNGHECVMARNSGIFEEGYIYAGEYLKRLKPDLIIGAHSWVMPQPHGLIDRYLQGAIAVRDAYQSLCPGDDYRYTFDPFWVRAEPYRQAVKRGDTVEVQVFVRNFRKQPQQHKIVVQTPPGVTAEPAVLEGTVSAESTQAYPLKLTIDSSAPARSHIVALDATLDGQHYGPWFDLMLAVQE